MKTLKIATALLLILSLATPLLPETADKPLSEKEKIEALIKHIEGLTDATFIRNGRDHDAKTAARFLRGKWRSQEKNIKTAAEFVDKAASVSSTSGKAYVIRFKGGQEVKCGEYLKAELKKIEAGGPP